MRFSFYPLLASSIAVVTVLSSPNPLLERAACNRDNCLRAISPSSKSPPPALASKDCSSFLSKTVTPCPTTTTKIVFTTRTNAAPTRTNSVTTTNTYSTLTSTLTVPFTVTQTSTLTTVVETDDLTATTSTTDFATTTITATSTLDNQATVTILGKRVVPPLRVPQVGDANNVLAGRVVPAPLAITNSPTKVPAYASACSGTARYSSACSCIGVSPATTTLTRSTVTVTSTSTVQFTLPTSTATKVFTSSVVAGASATSSQEFDVTVTSSIPTTLVTTVFTQVVTSDVTETSLTTVTTLAPAPTQTCHFNLLVVGGPNNGQFLQNQGQNAFAVLSNTPTTYQLDGSGQVLNTADTTQILNVDQNSYSFIDVDSDASISSGGFVRLRCTIATTPDHTFTCRSDNGLNTFYTTGGSFAIYPQISTSVPSGGTVLNFQAVSTC